MKDQFLTASIEEIIKLAKDANNIYQAELAEAPRRARCYHKSEIEICYGRNSVNIKNIKHGVSVVSYEVRRSIKCL